MARLRGALKLVDHLQSVIKDWTPLLAMAVQVPTKVIFSDVDPSKKVVLLAFDNVTTGDTYDLANQGFAKAFGAIFISDTNRSGQGLLVCTFAGTVATFATTGLANDGGYLFAVGE